MTETHEQLIAAKRELLRSLKREEMAKTARGDLLRFAQAMMPDPDRPDDPWASRYEVTSQARLLCEILEKVESGVLKRVAVSIGPQMGKSQLISRCFPAWVSGRKPSRHIMLASYNQDFANEFGDEVRALVTDPMYGDVFPEHRLRRGGQAKDLLITEDGGKLAFIGVGGSGTGKPADFFLVDDPIRSDKDVQSPLFRDNLWKWFNRTVFTRCHGKTGVVIVHTRWNLDDLIGRICDPEHPERNGEFSGIADGWTYINIPAVIRDPALAEALGLTLEPQYDPKVVEMFGEKPMTSLWPGKFPLEFLAEARRQDPAGFESLRMGRPTPEDGEYFKAEHIVEYNRDELPRNLTYYGASDHAVSKDQRRDYTVLGCVGVDEDGELWVLPDLIRDRMTTDRIVEEIVDKMAVYKPLMWFMESELISKSFGPFLEKRKRERGVFSYTDPIVPSKDKETRNRAIQGRMQMRMVHFPRFAPWWKDARAELLRFPNGVHDDFADFLGLIGLGLMKQFKASAPAPKKARPNSGTIEWLLENAKARAMQEVREKSRAGW